MVTYMPRASGTVAMRRVLNQRTHAPSTAGDGGRPAWMERALCRDVDPEIFYPTEGGPTHEALAICYVCPVVDDCLEWALNTETIAGCHGVAGGATARERAQMLRRRRRP